MNSKIATRSLVVMALFAALLCVSAYLSIPMPAPIGHITLTNFVVLLIAFLFPMEQSVTILLIWLLLGSVGVPVFIGGNAGISYLVGSSWGGYSLSFLLIAALVPLLRGKTYQRIHYTVLAIFAVLLIDVIGAIWLMFFANLSIPQAVLFGILPYLPLDLVKAAVVPQLVPQLQRVVTVDED